MPIRVLIVDDSALVRQILSELLSADPEVAAKVPPEELAEKFNLDYHFKSVDTIFARVFGE